MSGTRYLSVPLLLAIALGSNPLLALAADSDKAANDSSKTSKSRTDESQSNDEQHSAFVGVMVEELHPALMKHLPGAGQSGQGLLVESVAADSPAAQAGIKVHDILMTYDDQKLFSVEQFIKLIGSDQIGRELKLGLIREGKPQTVQMKLGERTVKGSESLITEEFGARRAAHPGWFRSLWGGQPHRAHLHHAGSAWTQFDSLTIKKLDKGRFHASIAYEDKDGKIQKHEFEGTREEIRKRIEADQAILPNERFHLLRGLDMPDHGVPLVVLPEGEELEF